MRKPYKTIQTTYSPQTNKGYSSTKFSSQYVPHQQPQAQPHPQPQYGDRQVPLRNDHRFSQSLRPPAVHRHQSSKIQSQNAPLLIYYGNDYDDKYVNYVPQQHYKLENVISDDHEEYRQPQGFEKVKQYQTPTPGEVSQLKHIEFTGGFQPITVTTDQPMGVPQGFSIRPKYKHVYQKPPVVDHYDREEEEKQVTHKYYDEDIKPNPQHKYETVTETQYDRPQTQQEYKAKQEQDKLQDSRNSLSIILKKLQESNTLPHTLTTDNIDNSIKTLVQILNNLKQTHKNVEVLSQVPINNYEVQPIRTSIENVQDEKVEEEEVEEEEEEGIHII